MNFARALVPSFVLGSFLALAACSGSTDADSLTESAEAGSALTVTSHAGSGREITYTFNRAVADGELDLSATRVLVMREQGDALVEVNVAARAELDPDQRTLRVSLREKLVNGDIYFGRARTAAELDLDLGDAHVLNGRFDGASDTDIGSTAAALTASTRVIRTNPSNNATNVKREKDQRRIVIDFDPAGTAIDCDAVARDPKSVFHLRTFEVGAPWAHDFYHDVNAPTPSDGGNYRGNLTCTAYNLTFALPGALFGDAWYRANLSVPLKGTTERLPHQFEFKTLRPGIQASLYGVENWYGGEDTCDGDDDYCDIYVGTAVATAGLSQAMRIPEVGRLENMRHYPKDINRGARWIYPGVVVFGSETPMSNVIELRLWAYDGDDESDTKRILTAIGKVATAIGPLVPKYGAAVTAGGAAVSAIAEAIPAKEDEFLGSSRIMLGKDHNRWNLYKTEKFELGKGATNRGPVKVHMYFEELPRAWSEPPVIQ